MLSLDQCCIFVIFVVFCNLLNCDRIEFILLHQVVQSYENFIKNVRLLFDYTEFVWKYLVVFFKDVRKTLQTIIASIPSEVTANSLKTTLYNK